MNRWLATKAGKDDPLLFVESIPVAETRYYVKRLMEYHWMYRRRLGQDAKSLDETARGHWPIYRPPQHVTRPAAPPAPMATRQREAELPLTADAPRPCPLPHWGRESVRVSARECERI